MWQLSNLAIKISGLTSFAGYLWPEKGMDTSTSWRSACVVRAVKPRDTTVIKRFLSRISENICHI